MITDLKAKWSGLGMVAKILAIVLLPIIILVALTKAGRALIFKLELNKQAAVQKESDKLDAKLDDLKVETSKVEGHSEQLEKDKVDAVKQTEAANPVDFYNSRYKPTDK